MNKGTGRTEKQEFSSVLLMKSGWLWLGQWDKQEAGSASVITYTL